MLRADDINSTLANGANTINALTNINEAHSADLARKKQAAMDRLRFDTEIGDVERQRQMELLKKYDDDSIFGGIKELMGKYKTENPVVANAGGGYDFDRQVSALTGGSQDNSPDMLMSKLAGLGRGTSFDEQRTKQLSRDIRSGYIQPVEEERDLVADQKTIDKWGDRLGVDRKSSARKQLVKDVKASVKRNVSENNALSKGMSNLNYKPEEKTTIEKPVGITRGDVKSYIRKAYDNGTFVKEFKGSYSDMDSQNLNMYKPLVDEAVANGDWKAADMLNRQYMANKRSIDKSWGEKEGRGGVDSLFSGPPKDRKADEPTADVPITVTNKKGEKQSVVITIPKRMLKNLHSKETLEHIYHAGNMTPEWDVRNGNAWFTRASNKDLEYDIFKRKDEEYARAQEDLQHGYGRELGDGSGGIVTANGKVVYPALRTTEAGMNE